MGDAYTRLKTTNGHRWIDDRLAFSMSPQPNRPIEADLRKRASPACSATHRRRYVFSQKIENAVISWVEEMHL